MILSGIVSLAENRRRGQPILSAVDALLRGAARIGSRSLGTQKDGYRESLPKNAIFRHELGILELARVRSVHARPRVALVGSKT